MGSLCELKKRFRAIALFYPRALVVLLFCGATGLTVTGTLPGFFHPEAHKRASRRTLTLGESEVYQRAIEGVYSRYLVRLKDRPNGKPSFDATVSPGRTEKKGEDYQRTSPASDDY